MKKRAVISLSGGMDSTCLLIHLLKNNYIVYGISFDYGQNHKVELERLQDNLEYLKEYDIHHTVIDVSQIGTLFESGLLNGDIPEGHYEEDNMKQTVVPNRNAIFSSISYGYALSISNRHECEVDIFLGVHSGDHAIYPDCRPEFYESLNKAFQMGNWDSHRVHFNLPYLHSDKTGILKDCLENCEFLGLDFDEVLKNTITSYNPDSEGRSSGKSGSDIERIEAFINIDRRDPITYVHPWEKVRENAIKVLQNQLS